MDAKILFEEYGHFLVPAMVTKQGSITVMLSKETGPPTLGGSQYDVVDMKRRATEAENDLIDAAHKSGEYLPVSGLASDNKLKQSK